MATEVIEKTFSVSGEAYLKLGNIAGSVSVSPGEEGQIQVTATKLLDTGDGERTVIEMEQSEDGRVTVKTKYPEGVMGLLMGSSPCKVDYVVALPQRCELRLSGVSCELTVQGLEGEIEVTSVSGDVRLTDLTGKLVASTVSGDLSAEELRGSLQLKTVSGNARLDGSTLETIKASTVSGSIKAESPLGAGPYSFQSVSGNVRIVLPEESPFYAELNSISGSLKVDLPGAKKTKKSGKQVVVYGEGGPSITAGTVSGDLRLDFPNAGPGSQDDEAAVEEVEAAENPAEAELTPEKRRAILEQISEGEISVEEALKTLQH